jgi:hypothetical protein
MGFWKEVKKAWIWQHVKDNWPDFLSIVSAVFLADEFGDKNVLVWVCVWIATYIASEFILRSISKLIKRVK